MNNRYLLWLVVFICGIFISCNDKHTTSSPYLSKLKADKSFPIYATYAAAMERSNFILDEGYEFVFYDSTRGVDFTTDTGGEIGLVFKQDDDIVYKLGDMYKEPIISKSYPDLVSYTYYPFKDVRVDAQFIVHSSMSALLDIKVTNKSDETIPLSVFAFMRKPKREFNKIEAHADSSSFYFMHNEYPDNWTISHDLPYITDIYNAFALSVPADKAGLFNSFSGESNTPSGDVFLERDQAYQIRGRAYSSNGERVVKQAPDVRLQVMLNGNQDELITEQSPVWGSPELSINNEGFFRVELGHLGVEKKSYTFTYYDAVEQSVYRYSEKFKKENAPSYRRDVTLHKYDLPPVPKDVMVNKQKDNFEITWENNSEFKYRIYRRTYPRSTYNLIAEDLKEGRYVDRNVADTTTYGYIVISVDPNTKQFGIHSREVLNKPILPFSDFLKEEHAENNNFAWAKVISFKKSWNLNPDQTEQFRLVRAVDSTQNQQKIAERVQVLLDNDLHLYTIQNEKLFAQAPDLSFDDPDKEALYWSANNMMRQIFYPPEGKSDYNYYVFSREPTWGWGHGGQVFHESITMLAYAYLDPESAMNSQRVYSNRQYDNGYINYRTGSYLDEIIKYNDQLTSSAPWYSWINWEVYKVTKDEDFLEEMYASSKKFYEFYIKNRDSDGDGLAEWGGHAVLESVRDASVAVWDQVGWPANFESVGLNCMLVKEAKSLENMALELGLKEEAKKWRIDYKKRTELINKTFWDSSSGFYYHVDKTDNDFTYETRHDLKRDEIIGFLPLWAGVASDQQAEKLLQKLTNPDTFWREYGVPSLSADDPYYNDKGYWNGPVWVEWNYLIMRGLLDYGYKKEAKELVDRVSEAMIIQLKKNHNLWEFYSPDDEWGGYHRTYIWAGIINRMFMDVNHIRK